MGNVQTILSIMRKYTPKGQEEVLALLKLNKAVISKEFGFAELPSIIAEQGKTIELEKQLLNNEESIRSIVTNELEKLISKDKTILGEVEKLQEEISRNEIFCQKFDIFRENILKGNFQEIRNNLQELLEKNFRDIKDYDGKKSLLKVIKNTEEPQQLLCNINNLIDSIEAKHIALIKKIEEQFIKTHFQKYNPVSCDRIIQQSLDMQQAAYRLNRNVADDMLKIFKAIVPKSKDKKVIEIENRLKQKYNLDFVRLYDIENAQKAEEILEMLANKNVELPKNYIISPFHFPRASFQGRHFTHKDGTCTIVLNPCTFDRIEKAKQISKTKSEKVRNSLLAKECIIDLNDSSTNHPLHTPIHEILHGENSFLTHRDIPAEYQGTVSKLSGYARECALSGKTKETITELRTEEVINGTISPDKKLLANYLA